MTDKQRVIRKYPKAQCQRSCHGTYWQISSKEWAGGCLIGEGDLPWQAWRDAARTVRRVGGNAK
jgi:hypothetical protein